MKSEALTTDRRVGVGCENCMGRGCHQCAKPSSTEDVARWKVTSYCLCPTSGNQGHFERNDEGVWVLHKDHTTEVDRLKTLLADLINTPAVAEAFDCQIDDCDCPYCRAAVATCRMKS